MDRPWLALALVLFIAPPMPIPVQIGPMAERSDGQAVAAMADPAFAPPASGFIENAGQLGDDSIRFYTTGPVSAAFTETGVKFRVQGPENAASYTMRFGGARALLPTGIGAMPGATNFILGSDPSRWTTGVASYDAIFCPDLYFGIDLRFLCQDGHLKYEFNVRPGGDPTSIVLVFDGAMPSVQGGSLYLDTPAGRISDSGFSAYQDTGAGRIAVEARMLARGTGVTYEIGAYDRSIPLVIDPVISSTVLGGSGDDYAISMTLDRFDNAYVTGETLSFDFPCTPNAWSNRSMDDDQTFDLFVVKLAPDGKRALFSTYIGSSGNDFAHDIRVDDSGSVFVTGYTYGFDFPVTSGAFDPTYNGYGDIFLLRLSPSGTTLVLSTFIGGDDVDFGYALALGTDGSMYVAGGTVSIDFPTTLGALQPSIRTGAAREDSFVLRLSANGSALEYCTYLGGGGPDHILGIGVDAAGNAFVTGSTGSGDFPTTAGAFSRRISGQDAFVAKLDPSGGSLAYSTFLGGTGAETGNALQVGTDGTCYVTGDTNSHDFPVVFTSDTGFFHGRWDCFAARLDATGANLLFSGYIGGSLDDTSSSISVDDGGNVTVTGTTGSANLPVTAAAENRTLPGQRNLFVARLDPGAQNLLYVSYLGGSGEEGCAGAALDGFGRLCIAGTTSSADFLGRRNGTMGQNDIFILSLAPVIVPGAPSMSLAAGHHFVALNWTAPSRLGDSLSGYRLYRGLSEAMLDVSWRIPPEVSDFRDEGLENGIYHYYALSAVNASGEGERSIIKNAMPGLRPSPPRNLTAAGRPSKAVLSWLPPEQAFDLPVLKYQLLRRSPGAPPIHLAELGNVTSYEDTTAFNDFQYLYSVSAQNIIGTSDGSNEAGAIPSERPSPPQRLKAYLDGRAVTLSWDAPDNPGIGSINDYFVYYQLDDGRRRLVGKTPVRLYVDQDLLAGTYRYRILANSTVGEGYLTDEIAVTITNQPPVAGYTVDALEGTSSRPFNFTSTSYDRDTRIVNYTWDLGDGARSYKEDPSHYYARRGVYNITLKVRDVDGAVAVASGMVSVLNTPPSIGAFSPPPSTTVYRGKYREFSITPRDPDADRLDTLWTLNGSAAGTGHTLRIRFDRIGWYVLTAVLGDGEDSAQTSWNVTVVPEPPPPPPELPWRWLLGAGMASAVAVSGLLVFRRRAAGPPAVLGTHPPSGQERARRPKRSKPRPGKRASQKPIIRKRYS